MLFCRNTGITYIFLSYCRHVQNIGCPCGYYGHPTKRCTCSHIAVSKYLAKVSGPLLDRLDLHVEVGAINFESLASYEKIETSAEIKNRVDKARKIQTERYKSLGFINNSSVTLDVLQKVCKITPTAQNLLKRAFDAIGISARGYNKILKVARTIADLDNSEIVDTKHIAEAIQYRSLDKKYWHK